MHFFKIFPKIILLFFFWWLFNIIEFNLPPLPPSLQREELMWRYELFSSIMAWLLDQIKFLVKILKKNFWPSSNSLLKFLNFQFKIYNFSIRGRWDGNGTPLDDDENFLYTLNIFIKSAYGAYVRNQKYTGQSV